MEEPLDQQSDYQFDLHFLDLNSNQERKDSFTNLMPVGIEVLPYFESMYDSLSAGFVLQSLVASSWEWESEVKPEDEETTFELPKRLSKPRSPKPVFRPHSVSLAQMTPHPTIIGTLTPAQRKEKISRFLEKRKRRNWTKKISYDCRKRVADNRLRVKGRFVTKTQAIAALGIDDLDVMEVKGN